MLFDSCHSSEITKDGRPRYTRICRFKTMSFANRPVKIGIIGQILMGKTFDSHIRRWHTDCLAAIG